MKLHTDIDIATVLADLRERQATAVREMNADNDHWEAIATGQDSEEAEQSGYLIGYAEGLTEACRVFGIDV